MGSNDNDIVIYSVLTHSRQDLCVTMLNGHEKLTTSSSTPQLCKDAEPFAFATISLALSNTRIGYNRVAFFHDLPHDAVSLIQTNPIMIAVRERGDFTHNVVMLKTGLSVTV